MRDSIRGSDVPSSIGMEKMDEVWTPSYNDDNNKNFTFVNDKSSRDTREKSDRSREVDAYQNPTELFKFINISDFDGAIHYVFDHPSDAKTWIISRGQPTSQLGKSPRDAPIKWRYLPLHLVCLKPNPSQQLVRALLYAYPKAAKYRDHNGNLPLHYILSEGSDDNDLIELLLDANPDSFQKKNSKGLNLIEIVSTSFHAGKISKSTMKTMISIMRRIQSGTSPNQAPTPNSRPSERDSAQDYYRDEDFDERDKPESYCMKEKQSRSQKRMDQPDMSLISTPTSKAKSISKSESKKKKQASIRDKTEIIDDEMSRLEEVHSTLAVRSLKMKEMLLKFEEHENEKEEWVQRLAKMESNVKEVQETKSLGEDPTSDIKSERELLREISKLEKEVREERSKRQPTSSGEIEKVKTEAQNVEARLNSTIASLERELLVALGAKQAENCPDDVTKEALRVKISALETEVLEAHEKKEAAVYEVEKIRTDAFIAESQLKGKISSLELNAQEASKKTKLGTQSDGKWVEKITILEGKLEKASKKAKFATHVDVEMEELRSKVTSLEGDLLEANNAQGSKALEDERKSLQLTNSSLQDHICTLKNRCNTLEQTNGTLTNENAGLHEKNADLSKKEESEAEFREKHRELQTEFQKLWLHVQNIPKDKEQIQTMALQPSVVEDYEQRVQALRDIITNNYAAHQQKTEALENREITLQEENKAFAEEVDCYKDLVSQFDTSIEKEANETLREEVVRLNELVRQFESNVDDDAYKAQLSTLQEEYKTLKETNSKLHDIIVKNNTSFMQKVDTIHKDHEECKEENELLHELTNELSMENSNIRNNKDVQQCPPSPASGKSFGQLSTRLNTVASYLISVSEMQKRIVRSGFECRQDENCPTQESARFMGLGLEERTMLNGSSKVDREIILKGVDELRVHQETIMDTIERHPERDVLGVTLKEQHQELEDISEAVGYIR